MDRYQHLLNDAESPTQTLKIVRAHHAAARSLIVHRRRVLVYFINFVSESGDHHRTLILEYLRGNRPSRVRCSGLSRWCQTDAVNAADKIGFYVELSKRKPALAAAPVLVLHILKKSRFGER